jgi:hypothetical protein
MKCECDIDTENFCSALFPQILSDSRDAPIDDSVIINCWTKVCQQYSSCVKVLPKNDLPHHLFFMRPDKETPHDGVPTLTKDISERFVPVRKGFVVRYPLPNKGDFHSKWKTALAKKINEIALEFVIDLGIYYLGLYGETAKSKGLNPLHMMKMGPDEIHEALGLSEDIFFLCVMDLNKFIDFDRKEKVVYFNYTLPHNRELTEKLSKK